MKHRIPSNFDIERNRARFDVEVFARLFKFLPPQGALVNTFGEGTDFREDGGEVNTGLAVVDPFDKCLDGQVDDVGKARDVTCLSSATLDRRITLASQRILSCASFSSKLAHRVPLFPALSDVMQRSFSSSP